MYIGVFALAILLIGCRSNRQESLPIARPPAISPQLPPAYEALPRLLELTYPVGDTLYTLLAIQRDTTKSWMPCTVDSVILLAAGPTDTLSTPITRIPKLTDLCLQHPQAQEPAVRIEPIDGGRSHVLIVHTWYGGNSTESFGTMLWRFPSLEPLLELTGLCRTLRLSPESLLVIVSYSDFLPEEISLEPPHALWTPILSSFWILEPNVSEERGIQIWHDFLEQERQHALRTYDSLLRHLKPEQWAGELIFSAITYIIASRLHNKTAEAEAFFRRELPRLRRLRLDPEALEYIRSALQAPLSPEVRPRHVFLHALDLALPSRQCNRPFHNLFWSGLKRSVVPTDATYWKPA